MIEEPPLLRIKQNWTRPDPALLARFTGALTGHVCDAQGGAGAILGPMPLPGLPVGFAGPAITVDAGPADVLAPLAAMRQAKPGDVMVLATGGHMGCAAMGDMLAGMARNAGIIAVITDGPMRDLAGLQEVGLPLFAMGLNPNSPFGSGPGKVGFPVHIGGQRVASGDIIVADSDGAVVVDQTRLSATADALDHVRALESGLEAQVKDGLAVVPQIEELIAAGRVVFED
jgi:4-hydroxy-4-methyl-2-oxoglutarate aldolase